MSHFLLGLAMGVSGRPMTYLHLYTRMTRLREKMEAENARQAKLDATAKR